MTKINKAELKKETKELREFGLTIIEISKLLHTSRFAVMKLLYEKDNSTINAVYKIRIPQTFQKN